MFLTSSSSRSDGVPVLLRGAGLDHGGVRGTRSVPQPLCLPPHLLHSALKPLQLPLHTLLLPLQQVPLAQDLVQRLLELRGTPDPGALVGSWYPSVLSTKLGHQCLQHTESCLQALHFWGCDLWAAGLSRAGHSEGVLASPAAVVSPPQRGSVLGIPLHQKTKHAQRQNEEHV